MGGDLNTKVCTIDYKCKKILGGLLLLVFGYGCDLGQFSRSPSKLCKYYFVELVCHSRPLAIEQKCAKFYAPIHKYDLRQLKIVAN
jgi:hypothetical protein